jgi:hypothetical protein
MDDNMDMDVSSVRVSQASAYRAASAPSAKAEAAETAEAVSKDAEAATFEADGGRDYSSTVTPARYTMDTETVERLKSESETRMANLVKQMLGQQIGEGVNIWEKLRTGDFEVDEETIKQAQADIAEDGYWGVEQTSDRFIQYATALTGGDPDKLDSMIEAFEQGYAEAEKAWGGTLPELSQKTREATLKKFQDLKDKYASGESGTDAAGAAAAQSLVERKVQEAAAAAAE